MCFPHPGEENTQEVNMLRKEQQKQCASYRLQGSCESRSPGLCLALMEGCCSSRRQHQLPRSQATAIYHAAGPVPASQSLSASTAQTWQKHHSVGLKPFCWLSHTCRALQHSGWKPGLEERSEERRKAGLSTLLCFGPSSLSCLKTLRSSSIALTAQ